MFVKIIYFCFSSPQSRKRNNRARARADKMLTINLFLFALDAAEPVVLFAIFADNFGEDAHVGTEEGEALHPDEGEGVVPLELQQVGRQQPRALQKYFI